MSPRRRSTALGIAGVAAGLAAAATAGRAAERRWKAAHDPCGPEGICTPPGEEFKVSTSDGAVLSGTVVGEGPPVVLSHCWTGSRDFWGPVARRLVERGHRVVLYDQRGHGESTVGEDGFSVLRLGHDLCEIVEHLDVEGAVVAGHSMGGMAAQAFAIEHPDVVEARVEGMVFAATTSHAVAPSRLGGREAAVLAHPRLGSFLERRPAMAIFRGTLGRVAVHDHVVATRDGFLNTPGPVRAGCYTAMQAMDLRDGLASVQVPVVVVLGKRDTLIAPKLTRSLADHLANARLVEIPDAGHMLPLEAPDVLAEIIAELSPST